MNQLELFGVPEVARALGVDQSTVHRRIYADKLTPALMVGNRPFFTAEDVAALTRSEQTLPKGDRK